jgi:hypothetical protein
MEDKHDPDIVAAGKQRLKYLGAMAADEVEEKVWELGERAW